MLSSEEFNRINSMAGGYKKLKGGCDCKKKMTGGEIIFSLSITEFCAYLMEKTPSGREYLRNPEDGTIDWVSEVYLRYEIEDTHTNKYDRQIKILNEFDNTDRLLHYQANLLKGFYEYKKIFDDLAEKEEHIKQVSDYCNQTNIEINRIKNQRLNEIRGLQPELRKSLLTPDQEKEIVQLKTRLKKIFEKYTDIRYGLAQNHNYLIITDYSLLKDIELIYIYVYKPYENDYRRCEERENMNLQIDYLQDKDNSSYRIYEYPGNRFVYSDKTKFIGGDNFFTINITPELYYARYFIKTPMGRGYLRKQSEDGDSKYEIDWEKESFVRFFNTDPKELYKINTIPKRQASILQFIKPIQDQTLQEENNYSIMKRFTDILIDGIKRFRHFYLQNELKHFDSLSDKSLCIKRIEMIKTQVENLKKFNRIPFKAVEDKIKAEQTKLIETLLTREENDLIEKYKSLGKRIDDIANRELKDLYEKRYGKEYILKIFNDINKKIEGTFYTYRPATRIEAHSIGGKGRRRTSIKKSSKRKVSAKSAKTKRGSRRKSKKVSKGVGKRVSKGISKGVGKEKKGSRTSRRRTSRRKK